MTASEREQSYLLGQVVEFTCLHLNSVIVVDDVITRLQATVMKVLILVDAGVVVVSKGRAGNARARINARHVVPDSICSAVRR